MTVPKANYVVDNHGQKIFVQLSLQDWKKFVNDFRRLENLVNLKAKLKNFFREIRQIQAGEKEGTTLNEFLNEL